MRAGEATPKRWPGWLRWLGWVGFAALFLATCLVVVRWMALGRGHARVQEIANRHHAQTKTVANVTGQQAVDAGSAHAAPKRAPLRELPLVGMAFSDDPAVRDGFGKQLAEVRQISGSLRDARDQDGIISFRKALEELGITVPAGMTEEEAAAEFLRQTEKVSGTLAQLRSALERGPWDWGEWRGPEDQEHFQRGWQLLQLLQTSANTLCGIIQAHWQTGDTGGAWGDSEMLHLLALRAGDHATLIGASVQASVQSAWTRAVGAGISLGGWTDAQLARIPESLASYDAFGSMYRGLEAEQAYLDDLSQRPGDVRTLMRGAQGGDPTATQGLGPMLHRLAVDLTTDQQIRDNLAVFAADHDFAVARFDFENRKYLPLMLGEQEPSFDLRADRSLFTDFYFMPFKELGGEYGQHTLASTLPSQALRNQAATDHARLAAALEIQHRAAGEYPDALDAVGGAFPGGVPHDVATGQPYFYERTPDGAYKLWGTGIDRTNDAGDPKKDILFTSPKLQTQ